MTDFKQWEGFEGRIWKEEVNTRDFIQKNYTPYDGDESFLATDRRYQQAVGRSAEIAERGARQGRRSGHGDRSRLRSDRLRPRLHRPRAEGSGKVVGLQTDKPLKRAFMPYGGIKMAEQACTTYGYQPSEKLHEIFTKYTRTHNQAVFDAYTPR